MSTIKLKRSAVEGKVPGAEDLELGELAINTFDGKLYLKKSASGANSIVDVTSGAGLSAQDILDQLKTVDGTGSGLDADLLDGQNSAFYLDYNNFSNTPTIPQSGVDFDPVGTDNSTNVTLTGLYDYLTITGQQITLNQIDYNTDITNLPTLYTTADANVDIDARVTKTFVDALNVDADTLDGQHSSFYQNASNLNTGTISDARLPATISSDITGNAATASSWATARTLSLTGAVTGSVSIDGSGNVSLATIATSDPTLTLAGDVTGTATFTNLGNATLTATVANDSHNHTVSTITDFTTGANTAIDNRVTKTFIDALNVDADTLDSLNSTQFLRSDTTDTASGNLTFTGAVNLNGDVQVNSLFNIDAETGSTTSTTQTAIAAFTAATYSSAKFVVQAKDGVTGEVHVTEILVVHNGTTASATEYGTIHTGSAPLATYDVDISSGNVRLLATAASTNSTTYKVTENLITV